eukprot:9949040-Lingulodinium_polyedra.AAC.1
MRLRARPRRPFESVCQFGQLRASTSHLPRPPAAVSSRGPLEFLGGAQRPRSQQSPSPVERAAKNKTHV